MRLQLLVFGALLAITTLGVRSAEAAAYVPEPIVAENVPVIAEHLARGGAADVPGVACATTCADWWLQEHRPIPNQPTSQALHAELRSARSAATKVLPRLRVLGTISLGVGTFAVGWKIGTGIRTKILKLGVPDPPQPKTSPASGTLRFKSAGYSSSLNTTPLPADGWVLHWWYGSSEWTAVNLSHGWGHACAYLTGPPADFRVLSGYATIGWCENPPVPVESYWLEENELRAVAPVEDYVDQPFDRQTLNWEDKPASKAQLETRTREALESDEYRLLDPWYAYQLDPQTYEDPTEDDDERNQCRPTDSAPSGDPAPLRGTQDFLQDPVRWRAHYDTVPSGEFPPSSVVPEDGLPATGGPAYMRWGWTSLSHKETIDWQGWGYRKIVAKHGWGATALERTSEALLSAPVRVSGYDRYVGPPYPSQSGTLAACEWVVSVQRDPLETPERPEQSEGVPMNGIITAHGRYVREG